MSDQDGQETRDIPTADAGREGGKAEKQPWVTPERTYLGKLDDATAATGSQSDGTAQQDLP